MNSLSQNDQVVGSKKSANPSDIKRRIRSIALTGSRLSWQFAKIALCTLCLLQMAIPVLAQHSPTDLADKSLEELMNIEVTSVSKKEEKLFQTAAAVYVITQADIRHSGLTSIPELLRLVPGMDVARIDGNKWAVSARGFNSRFTNKLLVLVDGRSIYTPETSGVYWEAQDMLLENIERIEVIRGPGGTLWGANAVNGVINIITKRAQDTQGGLVTAGVGSEERGLGSVRYGAKIGDNIYYRVYAKYFNRSGLVDAQGGDANDGQSALHGGWRVDWQRSERDALSVQGDIYDSHLRETSTTVSPAAPFAPFTNTRGEFSGGDVLGRWNHIFSERSDMALQLYVDRARREVHDLGERVDTFDFDFQHHLAIGRRQDLVWGFGYRMVATQTNSNSKTPVQFTPKGVHDPLYGAFVQDELTLVKDRLRLTLGTKFEHNADSGLEVQPSVRLLWTPSSRQTVWGAVSRAVRAPAISNQDVRIHSAAFPGPDGTPSIITLLGNPETKSEELLAYELGYRVQPSKKLSLDVASFYNRYDRLQTLEPERPFLETDPQPNVIIPLRFDNLMRGQTYGMEASVNFDVNARWKIHSGYSLLRMQLRPYAESRDTTSMTASGSSPQHQFQLQSYFKLPRNFEADAALYYVSSLPNVQVPSYTRLDVRFGRQVSEGVEVSVGAQNLLDNRHPEINGFDMAVVTSQVKRSVYMKLSWQF